MACLALPAVSAAEADSYSISFDEKSIKYMAPGEKGTIIVHAGEDRPSGNYSWVAAASTGTVAPITGTTSAENFTLTFTAPSVPADVTLGITLSNSNGTVNTTDRYTIHVVKPVVITAQVKNSGNVTMQDVPVVYRVDGKEQYRTTFTIGANATKTLTYNWTSASLSTGEHTVEIEIDPNSTFISFIDGTKVFKSTFYVHDSSWGLINILLTVMFVIVLLLLFFSYMNKGAKRKKRT